MNNKVMFFVINEEGIREDAQILAKYKLSNGNNYITYTYNEINDNNMIKIYSTGVVKEEDGYSYKEIVSSDEWDEIKTIMKDSGIAHMGIGLAEGDQRALDAAIDAMDSPLLETSVKGAKGLIVNVTGGIDLGLSEVSTAVGYIKDFLDPEANIIFGTIVDERIHDAVMVTVIATGIEENAEERVIKYNI